jgi:hypothetical protein
MGYQILMETMLKQIVIDCQLYLVGGFNPSEKYESPVGMIIPIYCGK